MSDAVIGTLAAAAVTAVISLYIAKRQGVFGRSSLSISVGSARGEVSHISEESRFFRKLVRKHGWPWLIVVVVPKLRVDAYQLLLPVIVTHQGPSTTAAARDVFLQLAYDPKLLLDEVYIGEVDGDPRARRSLLSAGGASIVSWEIPLIRTNHSAVIFEPITVARRNLERIEGTSLRGLFSPVGCNVAADGASPSEHWFLLWVIERDPSRVDDAEVMKAAADNAASFIHMGKPSRAEAVLSRLRLAHFRHRPAVTLFPETRSATGHPGKGRRDERLAVQVIDDGEPGAIFWTVTTLMPGWYFRPIFLPRRHDPVARFFEETGQPPLQPRFKLFRRR